MLTFCNTSHNRTATAGPIRRTVLLLGVVLLMCLHTAAAATNYDRLLDFLSQRFGPTATQSFRAWHRLVEDARSLPVAEKLKRVNEFFNRRTLFGEDQQIWGQSDYWATPMETLGKGKGDCEDFTIAKYFTLLDLGIPNEQLRLVYVKARIGGPSSTLQQVHMVLAYFTTPDAEPQVLDNLITDIRPASRRSDLLPIFSFNSQGIWAGAAGHAQTPGDTSSVSNLSRWQDLLLRARAEGFD